MAGERIQRPTDRFLDLRAQAAGGDVPIGGAYPESPHQRLGPGGAPLLRAAHHSTVELFELAKEARPRFASLYHLMACGLADEALLAERCEGKGLEFSSIGEVALKGFEERVRAWVVRWGSG